MELRATDDVYFDGSALLMLAEDGERGSGVVKGTVYVFVGTYQATYEIVNEVLSATVTRDGILNLHVRVLQRHLAVEHGAPPDPRFRGELANREFDEHLEPVPGAPRRLRGRHYYERANQAHQVAEANYHYFGLIGG